MVEIRDGQRGEAATDAVAALGGSMPPFGDGEMRRYFEGTGPTHVHRPNVIELGTVTVAGQLPSPRAAIQLSSELETAREFGCVEPE
jgi:hypothetical protein